jgi:vacuolar protein sorting-associated protein 13A/C
MLEGLVAGLLNRFIGPYVTNLDVSQLNIAIWSGTFSSKRKGTRIKT